jgi:hypothetical protein
MGELTVILWRDIPAQVTATNGSATARRELPERFQKAIDAAAMKAGSIESEAYLEGWRRTARPCGADLEAEVAAEAERLDAAYDRAALLRLTRSGGVEQG